MRPRVFAVAAVSVVALVAALSVLVLLDRSGSLERTPVCTSRSDSQPYQFLLNDSVHMETRWLGLHFRRPKVVDDCEKVWFHIAVVRLERGEVLRSRDLVDVSGIMPVSILSLPATPELLMGGGLKRGDVVVLFAFFPTKEEANDPNMISLWNVVILDVHLNRDGPGAVVVAIAADERLEFFLEHYRPGSIILATYP